MKTLIKTLDEKVDKLKNNSFRNNNNHLVLNKEEYKELKKSLTSIKNSEILNYRGIRLRIIKSRGKTKNEKE